MSDDAPTDIHQTVEKRDQEFKNSAWHSLVSVHKVSKQFGERVILDSVDFGIDPGEISVVIGRSGSGKSTLLRVISGLTDPDDGDIYLSGKKVTEGGKRTSEYPTAISAVGMIFQTYTLWPNMNVLDNLTLAPRKVLKMAKSEAEDRARIALREVGMEQHYRSRTSGLSGGERQRVAIARALMMRPRLLLCDEITSALDPPVAAEVLSVLTRLTKEEGIGIILVTHDMAFASKAADRVAFFANGRTVVDAPPEEVFERCQNSELREFVDAVRMAA
jgi:ABC-type polar amino acid transport system ATPase subunit